MNIILEAIVVGDYQVNCYLFGSAKTKEIAIIDPGSESQKIKRRIERLKLKPIKVINTHGHFDHIGADSDFGLPILIHKLDADCLVDSSSNLSALLGANIKAKSADLLLEENDIIKIGDVSLKIIHTPGHTPGGISLIYDDIIFTGDTLFHRGVGRTDFSGASYQTLVKSIKNKLFCYDDKVAIYPGHGPSSTIGDEKRLNEFI